MNAYIDTADSPAGPVAFAVNEMGALLKVRFLEGHYKCTMEQELERRAFTIRIDQSKTLHVRDHLAEYSRGSLRTFELPLALSGSPWQLSVWHALLRIPYGETRTYGEIAAMVGRPHAARAVGRANATNHLPLVIPCHRVVGSKGRLTGFAGGISLKDRLLAHERNVCARTR